MQALRERHAQRVAADNAYQALLAQERAVQKAADATEVSLLETRRKEEHERTRKEQNDNENRIRAAHGLPPVKLEDVPEPDDTEVPEEEEDEDKFDVVLDEAGNVLRDLLVLQGVAGAQIATTAASSTPPAATTRTP